MDDKRLNDFVNGYQSLDDRGKLLLELSLVYILLRDKPDLGSMRLAAAIIGCAILPRVALPALVILALALLVITFCNMTF